MNKLIVKTLKPRNPLVRASLMRKAGVHRSAGGALRQQARRALQRESADSEAQRSHRA